MKNVKDFLMILPKAKSHKEPDGDEEETDDGDENFSEVFKSLVKALGVDGADTAKAEKRMKTLIRMVCSKYM
jgi:hypothetical protein